MKNILIINAHPIKDTFCDDIVSAYSKGALSAGATVEILNLIDLHFDPILKESYKGKDDLESDLIDAQNKIRTADHLVFAYPNWWGTYPALLKGFIDRAFLPGFAFDFVKGKPTHEKLLKGISARVFVTMDMPVEEYESVYKSPGDYSLKKSVLEFCGVEPVSFTHFTPMRKADERQLEIWLDETRSLGERLI